MFRGMPASGKTTQARAWVAEDPQRRARVNRDDLRSMLHGGFVDRLSEAQVVAARDALIDALLRRGVSVANDDTNLPDSVAAAVCEIGATVGARVRVLDLTGVDVETCVYRDSLRPAGERVGEQRIRQMHATSVAS